jgi:methionyl-tRNA formyltransferase
VRVLLLTRRSTWGNRALEVAKGAFSAASVEVITGEFGDAPPTLATEDVDVLLSFLAPWVVPPDVLKQAPLALNFHPGPRQHPGIGCYNFALYDGDERYGCVCHHMEARVDSGAIVAARSFGISSDDTVESLQQRTLTELLTLFEQMCALIVADEDLVPLADQWTREPRTRTQLEALCRVTPDMSDEEVRRRVRAVTYPGKPGAFVELAGMRFVLPTG